MYNERNLDAILIEKCENGFIVNVHRAAVQQYAAGAGESYEEHLGEIFATMAEVVPDINKLGGKGAVEGIDAGMEPWKENAEDADNQQRVTEVEKEKVKAKIRNSFKAMAKPLASVLPKKTQEFLVFPTLDGAIDFIKKEFAPPAPKPPGPPPPRPTPLPPTPPPAPRPPSRGR